MTHRSETWSKYSGIPLRVKEDVFLDVFKLLFNAVESEPETKLSIMVDPILKTLEVK